ncbi:MAG: hypothetical protein EBR82_67630 [Caulobacteraceae bacterium]|nr:hypothetical protein [Caulobacteraceae bacterium]
MSKGVAAEQTAVEPKATASAGGGDVFDFTVGPEVMDPVVLAAYYRVRRAAMQRNDASLMPEGKKLTRKEIEEIIGGELGAVQGPRPCCV